MVAVQRIMPAIREAIGAKTLDPKLLTAAEDALDAWRSEAEASLLGTFTRVLQQDHAAVAAALRKLGSNRQTEGQVNRPKTTELHQN